LRGWKPSLRNKNPAFNPEGYKFNPKAAFSDMKNRPLAVVLSIFAAFCFFYGCASAPSAKRPNLAVDPKPPPLDEAPALKTPDEPGQMAGEEPLPEDELGWEDENNQTIYAVADPLEPFNRAMYVLNDRLYFWLMKPVARGYQTVVPQPARGAVQNFFVNLGAPIRIVNNILQGKIRNAETEWARFLYNSTVGVLGFGDPAAAVPKLALKHEDLGLTLADYGIGDGFFIFWPVLGPSTLRDSVGLLGDHFLNPVAYINPVELSFGISGYHTINYLSLHIGDYEALKKAALDPYESIRNAYIQLRQAEIRRGR
jgi:phospholipid-binding lipoprotein MlaA